MADVNDLTIIVTLLVFIPLLLFAIQQTCVENTNKTEWMIYRIFVIITVLNEVFMLVFLLVFSFDNDNNQIFTQMIRIFRYINLFVSSYITYRLGMMLVSWFYKQLKHNPTAADLTPKWFRILWIILMSSNSLLIAVFGALALYTNSLDFILYYDIYFNFTTLFVTSSLSIVALRVCWNLHKIITKNSNHAHAMSVSDDIESENNLNRTATTVLKRARNKILCVFVFAVTAVVVSFLAAINSVISDTHTSDKATDAIYQDVSSFLGHFIYAFFYINIIMFLVATDTKCCANSSIPKDSFYYSFFITRLGFKGFTKPRVCCTTTRTMLRALCCCDSSIFVATLRPDQLSQSTTSQQHSNNSGNSGQSPVPNSNGGTASMKNGGRSLSLKQSDGYNTSKESKSKMGSKDNSGNSGNGNDGGNITVSGNISDNEDSIKDVTLVLDAVDTMPPLSNNNKVHIQNDALHYNNGPEMFKSKVSRHVEKGLFLGNIKNINHPKHNLTLSMDLTELGMEKQMEKGKSYTYERSIEPTPTQAIVSSRSPPELFSKLGELDESAKMADLTQINYKGQKLYKRQKPRPDRINKDNSNENENENNGDVNKQNENDIKSPKRSTVPIADEKEDPMSVKLAGKEATYAPYLGVSEFDPSADGSDNRTEMMIKESSNDNGIDGMKTINEDDDMELKFDNDNDNNDENDEWDGIEERNKMKPKHPISLIIFEYEYVLATEMKSVWLKTARDIANTDLKKMLFTYGGVERVDELHLYLTEKLMPFEESTCFLITKERSETVFKALERVDFAQYFMSLTSQEQNGSKKLSHVIGTDHRLTNLAEGKRHILVLKLMKLLKRDHDSVLYIGHDKKIIDHLHKIDICYTYWVKTKGLIHKDLEFIAKNYFDLSIFNFKKNENNNDDKDGNENDNNGK